MSKIISGIIFIDKMRKLILILRYSVPKDGRTVIWRVLIPVVFALAIFGTVHHFIVAGRWFDWETMAHHEPLIATALAVGITLTCRLMISNWRH